MLTPTIPALLRQRLDSGSRRGERTDSYHLALVIEGGGMRGIVGISMAAELQRAGFRDAFDSIHGSSAGACAAAYFAAHQSEEGVRIYLEDINNRRFIDAWRFLGGRAVLDKSFLVDHVMQKVTPLDASKILVEPGLLNVVVTDARTAEPIFYDRYQNAEHLFTVLKGTICLPLIAGHSVSLDGRQVFDGGMTQQIAIDSALRQGATHVLVLVTRKEGEMERPMKGALRQPDLIALGAVYGGAVYRAYSARNAGINNMLKRIRDPIVNGIHFSIVARKHDDTEVDRLTIDAGLLERADVESRQAMQRYLSLTKTDA